MGNGYAELSLGCPGLRQLSATPPVLQPLPSLCLGSGFGATQIKSHLPALPLVHIPVTLWLCDWLFFTPQIRSAAKTNNALCLPTRIHVFPVCCSARLSASGSEERTLGCGQVESAPRELEVSTCFRGHQKTLETSRRGTWPPCSSLTNSDRKHLLRCYCALNPTRLLAHIVILPALRGG